METPGEREANDPAIRVEDVAKRYGRGTRAVQALDGVTLSVARGEIYGLLGRNGAGKTTLVKILLDIVRADRGEALLGGAPARRPSARRSVGYLPEDHQFPEYQTGEGAMRFYAALSGKGGRTIRRRTAELLDVVELGAAAGKKIRTYSKGMKQRLGLAQALAHDPDILFLDEPTDGVDPVGRAKIRDLLLRLKAEGKTIFLNSHLLGETERVCDKVGILDGGRLVEEGTIQDLTTADRVYTLRTDRPPPEAALAELRRAVASVEERDGQLELRVAQDAEVDRAIDALRAAGIGIRALSRKRISLEDVFLAAVEAGNGREVTP